MVSEYYCFICKKGITEEECSYSKAYFDMALCCVHQDIQRKIREKADQEGRSRFDELREKFNSDLEPKASEPLITANQAMEKNGDSLINWLKQWVVVRSIDQSLESKHFFVDGMQLEEFSRDVLAKAKDEVLVTSPFLDSCFLSKALQDANARHVNVKVIARRPTKDNASLDVWECQESLKNNGIVLHHINAIHSSIIVIDQKIVVFSSMNLFSGSTGGGLLGAGIITFESTIVESIKKYVNDLLAKPESPDATKAT
jgi:hypothetical protein